MSWSLVPHLVRAVSWWPPAAATLLAILAQMPLLAEQPSPRAVLIGLWLAAGVLGAGAAFALPDVMASTVITPVSRWVRQWLRIGLVVVPAGLVWAVLHLMARRVGAEDTDAVAGGFVALQAAVCGLLPVAAAAVGARHRDTATAALAGPAVQGIALVGTLFFTGRSSPWSVPGTGDWTVAQQCWPVALGTVLSTLLIANRDTVAARRDGSGRHRRPTRPAN